jgi:hypothetical protein
MVSLASARHALSAVAGHGSDPESVPAARAFADAWAQHVASSSTLCRKIEHRPVASVGGYLSRLDDRASRAVPATA